MPVNGESNGVALTATGSVMGSSGRGMVEAPAWYHRMLWFERIIGASVSSVPASMTKNVENAQAKAAADRIRRYYGRESTVIYPPQRRMAAAPTFRIGSGMICTTTRTDRSGSTCA
jgi:hypothetical protein